MSFICHQMSSGASPEICVLRSSPRTACSTKGKRFVTFSSIDSDLQRSINGLVWFQHKNDWCWTIGPQVMSNCPWNQREALLLLLLLWNSCYWSLNQVKDSRGLVVRHDHHYQQPSVAFSCSFVVEMLPSSDWTLFNKTKKGRKEKKWAHDRGIARTSFWELQLHKLGGLNSTPHFWKFLEENVHVKITPFSSWLQQQTRSNCSWQKDLTALWCCSETLNKPNRL